MRFTYRALNGEGSVVTGILDSDNLRTASRRLHRQGLTPVSVMSQTIESVGGKKSRRVRQSDVVMVMQQLTTLLKAGVSLGEAISSLSESTRPHSLQQEIADISARLRRGESFSGALKASKIKLPSYIHHLAEAGELTGNLAQALSDGLAQMEYEQKLASELKSALIYPSILIVSGIAAVMLIFIVVVPKFVPLLAKSQGDIPFLAQAVLGTGQFMNENIVWLSVAGIILSLAAVAAFSKPSVRQQLWDLLLRMPLLGPWLLEADIGRWSAMLATLLDSRIELTRALELAQQGVDGSRLRSNLTQVTRAVRGGDSLAAALQESGAITSTGYGLIRVGERSGELPRMLN
ncbi:MAG: type II secretion system F family protein, partial [Pseudomonadota bacterium]|nr:type II secretion system F family protein [Pseudomonadota bacterium]